MLYATCNNILSTSKGNSTVFKLLPDCDSFAAAQLLYVYKGQINTICTDCTASSGWSVKQGKQGEPK